MPTLTLVKLVDGDGKTGNPSEKGGDLYWSIEGPLRHLLLGGSLGMPPPQKICKKLELKYEVSCIFRHVYSKENEKVPQKILCKKLKKNTYNHRQLKIVLELSLEDFYFPPR